jgi:signal transduction histidine kinase
MREIESAPPDRRRRCRQARRWPSRPAPGRGPRAADQANQAKSRYISAISHELRTPLNSILGYAQLMGEDAGVPPHRKQAVA